MIGLVVNNSIWWDIAIVILFVLFLIFTGQNEPLDNTNQKRQKKPEKYDPYEAHFGSPFTSALLEELGREIDENYDSKTGELIDYNIHRDGLPI